MSHWKKKRRFMPCKLRQQVALLLVCTAVLPVMALSVINIWATSKVVQEQNQETLEDHLHLSEVNLHNALSEYSKLMLQICTDSNYYENLSKLARVDEKEYAYRNVTQSLMDAVRSKILPFPEIQAVGIIAENGMTYLYTQQRPKTQPISSYFYQHADELREKCSTLSSQLMEPIDQSSEWYDPVDPFFYIAVPCLHYDKMRIEGCLVLFISSGVLQNITNNPSNHTYNWTDMLVVSGDGQVLTSKKYPVGTAFTALPFYQDIAMLELGTKPTQVSHELLISGSDIGLFNVKLYSLGDYHAYSRTLHNVWAIMLIALGIVLIIVIQLCYTFVKRFVGTVEHVAHAMEQVDETHLDIVVPENSLNELQVIEQSFNRLTRELRGLLKQNRIQYERLIALNQKACEAELKSLELQINPHFLFNTIDAINWLAIQDGSDVISDQLNRLSVILRHTVYHMNATVPIARELDWIKAYLDLQRIRFADGFEYSLQVDPSVQQIPIHKLLLQPFLENAILHGFEDRKAHGKLILTVRRLGTEWLLLRVSDNGTGIPSNELKAINQMFNFGQVIPTGIGLSNITYRMRGYYPGSRLHASSGGGWTRFSLYIRMDTLEEQHA